MNYRKLFILILLAVFALPSFADDASQNPSDLDRLIVAFSEDAGSDAEMADMLLRGAKDLKSKNELYEQLLEKAYEYGLKENEGYPVAIEATQLRIQIRPSLRTELQERLIAAYELAYKRSTKKEKDEKTGPALLAILINVADDMIERGETVTAIKYYTRAVQLISLYGPKRKLELDQKRKMAQSRLALERDIQTLEYRLSDAEDGQQSYLREKLIRIYVAELDKPAKAKALLNDHVDAEWQKLVPLAAMPTDKIKPEDCLELGTWYKQLFKKASDYGQPQSLSRARGYYESYLAKVSKDKKVDTVIAKMGLEFVKRQQARLAKEAQTPLVKETPEARVVYVPAGRDWTCVMPVKKGDIITFEAQGKWSPKPGVVLDAEGSAYSNRYHLQGRISVVSNPFKIGVKKEIVAQMDGLLFLGMKDDWRHWDNSGVLTVMIHLKRPLFEETVKK